MIYTVTVVQDSDASYLKEQEQILTHLISQIAPGYACARLQIQLQHTRTCLADLLPRVSIIV